MCCRYRIDVDRVERSLRVVQKDFEKINETLEMRREPMREDIVANMVSGYRYVNKLLGMDVSLLKREGLHHFLELNHIILCGTDKKARKDFRAHIEATTNRFYQQKEFCVSHIRTWAENHEKTSPWKRAAGVYIMHISQPQLFLEGNHRTGALLMSSILVRRGKPPFVLGLDNAKAYFDPSSLAKKTQKNLLGRYYVLPNIRKKFTKFLKKQADFAYLVE